LSIEHGEKVTNEHQLPITLTGSRLRSWGTHWPPLGWGRNPPSARWLTNYPLPTRTDNISIQANMI